MTILRDISYLWSTLHIIAIFLLFFEPRYSWRTTLWAGFAGAGTLLAVNVLAMFWLGHGIIMSLSFFSCTIPTLLLFFLLSKYRDGRFFFLFCLSDTTCFWILQLTNFLDRLTGDTYVVLLIGRLLIFPIAEYFFWRYLRTPYLELQRQLQKGWWLIAATGAIYYLLFMLTSVPVDTPMPNMVGLLRILLVMLLMPLTYFTILASLWRQLLFYANKRQMERQRQDYNALCQKMELGRIYRHDMRHHMRIVENMLQQNDNAGARQYIQELSGRLQEISKNLWTNNPAINAVLSAYIPPAEQEGCQIKADVNIPAELPYKEMDLCVITANALENAIQACRRNPADQRWLNVRLDLSDNQRFMLAISNACPQPVKFARDGLPVRSKPTEGHGIGLRSMKKIADRYGGLLRCEWADGVFQLNIVLFPNLKAGAD